MKDKAEPTAEWEAEVNDQSNGENRADTHRKVKTNAITRYRCPSPTKVKALLRAGHEIRFTDEKGRDMIRIFPCLDSDYRFMSPTAQAMGEFREKTYEGIRFSLRRRGERVSVESRRKARQERTERIKAKRGNTICVTPDTMVECPNCGTTFRVGKTLVNEK